MITRGHDFAEVTVMFVIGNSSIDVVESLNAVGGTVVEFKISACSLSVETSLTAPFHDILLDVSGTVYLVGYGKERGQYSPRKMGSDTGR